MTDEANEYVLGTHDAELAVKRSVRFADATRRRSERARHDNVTVVEGDLMHLVPPTGCDAA